MRTFAILLKKEFSERLSNLKQKKKDIVGLIFNTVLLFAVVFAFIAVFVYLTKTYVSVKVGYITDKTARVYELCTIFFFVALLILIFMGISKLNKNLIDVGNLSLLSMPISPFQIFISKLFVAYIDLILSCFVITLPMSIIFVVQGFLSWWVILFAVFISILLPIFALGVASIFTIPYYYIKKWLNKHFIIQLVVYVCLMGVAFFVYSIFLKFVKGLMESGQISFFFNQNIVNTIGKFCKFAFPANVLSGVLVGNSVFLNLLYLILGVGASGVICFYLSKFIFSLVRQNRIGVKESVKIETKARKPKNTILSLINREFINVLRTPSYTFSYFAIVLSLPLMIVVTSSLLISMIKNLTLLDFNFQVVLCTFCMYSILLNSFCSNNISRDGRFFYLMKTYPVSPKEVILSKILFCSISSFVSILISGIAIWATGQLPFTKVLAVMIISIVLNFSIICLATRKDLNTIKHARGSENPSSTNFVIFLGLVFAVGFTIVAFLLSIWLKTMLNVSHANFIIFTILFVASLIVLAFALLYLFRKLDNKYKEIVP